MPEPQDKPDKGKEVVAEKAPTGPPRQAAPETGQEEWIFTMNPETGEAIKVEHIDRETGQRQELTEDEYLALSGYDLSGSEDYAEQMAALYDPYSGDYGAAAYDPYSYEEGYYQGWADHEAAAAAEAEAAYMYASPEELAYWQGMADYEAMVTQAYGG